MTYLWQVAVHSAVMGAIFYAWVHRVDLPSGRTKRHLLILLLVLPLVTAAVPGRSAVMFGERLAWFSSVRVADVPIFAGAHLYHVAWLLGGLMTILTIWQEVLPSFRHPRSSTADVPEWLLPLVRGRTGWAECAVAVSPLESVMLATAGWPGRARLIVSRGALTALSVPDVSLAIAHEHAHWVEGRWWKSHLLFLARLLQCYHPTALWAFREYCIEEEIACDAVAVADRDHASLVRILLHVYKETDPRDVAARSALRKRVDVLMSGGPQDAALPPATIVAAAGLMLAVLPWIV